MLDATRMQWPPPAIEALEQRQRLLEIFRKEPSRLTAAKKFYAKNQGVFVNTWCDTFDPRNAQTVGRTTRMPFVLFPRQWDFFTFLRELKAASVSGLVEKSRDMGATWGACGYSVSDFLFVPGTATGWGSRKAELVDNGAGDLKSIFEKMRYMIRSIPSVFYPRGFDPDKMSYMKIACDASESSITGESGDNIGRGGRTSMYFKDESAWYERPDAIEAALADNTNVQVDISSVHGLGNVFHRKRESGVEWTPGAPMIRTRTNIFIMDWRDHPAKNQQWYDERREKDKEAGLLHVFKQEVDRDYAAALEGAIIPGEYIKAAIDAHLKIPGMDSGGWCAGLDVADEGLDLNAFVRRKGVVINWADEWGDRDPGVTTRRSLDMASDTRPIDVYYDCIGIGSSVKSEVNRLLDLDLVPSGIRFLPWNAGAKVMEPEARVNRLADGSDDPESATNEDFFQNLKAQGWWMLRRRFEKTWRYITEGARYPVHELISIDSRIPKLRSLEKELAQPTKSKSAASLKLVVDKTPKGTKSPNMGDATMQCFTPIVGAYDSSMSWVGI